jgi:MATE family multidrug resistance protein
MMRPASFWRMYRSHFKATILLAWPIIVGQLGQVFLGVIDLAMVGRVGKSEIAAAGVANAVFFIVSVFGIGVSTAVSPLVSIAATRGNKEETAGILKGAYLAGAIVALFIAAILFFLSFHFHLFGQEEHVAGLAGSFLRIISFSVIPMTVFLCAKQFTDGLSLTRVSMFIMLIALPLNAGLNYLWIYGNWGFPAMGLNGAGYATLLTRLLMMIAIMLFIRRSSGTWEYTREKAGRAWPYLKKIMRLGVPSGLQYFFEVAAFGGAAIMAGWISVDAAASHQIAINLASLTYMAAGGIAVAGSIRVGAASGGYSKQSVRISGNSALYIGIAWMAFWGLLFFLIPHFFVGLYIDGSEEANQEVERIAVILLLIAALFQLSDGVQCICLGLLRGLRDVKVPAAITFMAYWIIGLPVGFLLGFSFGYGVAGIWIGLLIGLTLSATLLTYRFYKLSGR